MVMMQLIVVVQMMILWRGVRSGLLLDTDALPSALKGLEPNPSYLLFM